MKSTCDKIIESVFLGNRSASTDLNLLQSNQITHVIIAAYGLRRVFPSKFAYLSLKLTDKAMEDIIPAMEQGCQFIEQALSQGGKVFVHCLCGMSRSSSIVIAYLIKTGMTFEEAFQLCKKKHKDTNPNYGFQQQLKKYEIKVVSYSYQRGNILDNNTLLQNENQAQIGTQQPEENKNNLINQEENKKEINKQSYKPQKMIKQSKQKNHNVIIKKNN